MKKIVLLSCGSKKVGYKTKSQNLYISNFFKKCLQYAKLLKPANIFILSAKYGLVDLEKEIEPYDLTLNKMLSKKVKEWANSVLEQLRGLCNLQEDEFIFLAGDKYRKYLLPNLRHYKFPMKGLPIGKQLQWLNKQIKNEQKL